MDSGATIFCLNIDSPLPSYAGILYLNFSFCKIKIRWSFARLLATTTGIWMGHAYVASGRLLFFLCLFLWMNQVDNVSAGQSFAVGMSTLGQAPVKCMLIWPAQLPSSQPTCFLVPSVWADCEGGWQSWRGKTRPLSIKQSIFPTPTPWD